MKFIPFAELEIVSRALNFDTVECYVRGACEIFTTKAAGGDKKLYKNINGALLVTPYCGDDGGGESGDEIIGVDDEATTTTADLNLNINHTMMSNNPFGSFRETANRRKYIYLIATLNASYPDYDFSHVLNPSDFERRVNLLDVMKKIDTSLYNVRPKTREGEEFARLNGGMQLDDDVTWDASLWKVIDKEMNLQACEIYSWNPKYNPFEDDERTQPIWRYDIFFYNGTMKRVCYFTVRGLSALSATPLNCFDITCETSPRLNLPQITMGIGINAETTTRSTATTRTT